MTRLVTTQAYINNAIVEDKIASEDYSVQVTPEFELNGELVRFIVDGNHSYQAALQAGVDPDLEEYDSCDFDAIIHLERGDVESFIDSVWDSALYYADTEEMI